MAVQNFARASGHGYRLLSSRAPAGLLEFACFNSGSSSHPPRSAAEDALASHSREYRARTQPLVRGCTGHLSASLLGTCSARISVVSGHSEGCVEFAKSALVSGALPQCYPLDCLRAPALHSRVLKCCGTTVFHSSVMRIPEDFESLRLEVPCPPGVPEGRWEAYLRLLEHFPNPTQHQLRLNLAQGILSQPLSPSLSIVAHAVCSLIAQTRRPSSEQAAGRSTKKCFQQHKMPWLHLSRTSNRRGSPHGSALVPMARYPLLSS